MRRSVHETVYSIDYASVCLSSCFISHPTAAAECGGFAAECRAGRPATTAPQHKAAARRSAANASSVTLTAEV